MKKRTALFFYFSWLRKPFCTLQDKRTKGAQITLMDLDSPAIDLQYCRKRVLHPIKYRRMNLHCQTERCVK